MNQRSARPVSSPTDDGVAFAYLSVVSTCILCPAVQGLTMRQSILASMLGAATASATTENLFVASYSGAVSTLSL